MVVSERENEEIAELAVVGGWVGGVFVCVCVCSVQAVVNDDQNPPPFPKKKRVHPFVNQGTTPEEYLGRDERREEYGRARMTRRAIP